MILNPGANAYDRTIDGLPPIECQNMYPERVPNEIGAEWVLVSSPGQKLLSALGGAPRGAFSSYGVFNGDILAVYATTLYRVNSAGVSTPIGTVPGADRVIFTSVRGYIAFTANGEGWVVDPANNLTQITDPDLPTVNSVTAMDGRLIFTEAGTDRVWWSGIFDPTNIDDLAFATAETFEDQLVRVIADHRELWLFGQQTIEVWRPVADFEQPFQRVGDLVLEKGCLSPLSIVKADNTLFWVGQDAIVYKAEGVSFKRVSNHGIDRILSGLTQAELATVYGFSYTDDGHIFYVMTIPGVATVTYDAATGSWQTRKSDGMTDWSPIEHVYAFSKNYVVTTGGVLELTRDELTDRGTAIERMVSFNIPSYTPQAIERVGFTAFAFDQFGAEASVNLLVSFSDDAGRSYSTEETVEIHANAQYSQRTTIFRQGQIRAPGRAYRIRCVDPVRITIGPVFVNEAMH